MLPPSKAFPQLPTPITEKLIQTLPMTSEAVPGGPTMLALVLFE